MKRLLASLLLPLVAFSAQAALNVFATVPEWAALVREIGGDKVRVFAATQALQDPHRVEAKPSLIARLRNADLVIATGAELEVGWLPLALRESGNGKVQPGQPGYFEAAGHVRRLEIPARVDRADGDVHAAGNPHIQTDPRNILKVGEALATRLGDLDAANAAAYAAGYKAFAEKWRAALARWEAAAAPLRGQPVVSQHKAWPYLYDWLGLKEVATLEPKPGVEPSLAYLGELTARLAAQPPKAVIRAAYNAARAADWYAQQAHVPQVVLPFTVGGSDGAKDLFGLFDDTVARLKAAIK
ncbi:MAG: zinc ABC transporter substrate-binding protein [Rhodocyclaceae bacterium]|jgi:zinc/manganese transport system substrate-binding protein|nr:zinc ABC transporter substrate-binding protein [Rhodocyclaceae bacterium]